MPVADRLQGKNTPKGTFVDRFQITAKGVRREAGLALDVNGGIPAKKRQALVQRFLKLFLSE